MVRGSLKCWVKISIKCADSYSSYRPRYLIENFGSTHNLIFTYFNKYWNILQERIYVVRTFKPTY